MNEIRETLLALIEYRGIGEFRIGNSFETLAREYGNPTFNIDPREVGLGIQYKIWEFDAIQVWSNKFGVIDRVFFRPSAKLLRCDDLNFKMTILPTVGRLALCDLDTFLEVFNNNYLKIKNHGTMADVTTQVDHVEYFAQFDRKDGGEPLLKKLRVNELDSNHT